MARHLLRRWWKSQPDSVRRPLVFAGGMVLVVVSPFIGWLPGPGGLLIFLGGISVLASEFDWAENLKAVFTEKVPQELKRRWRPTPRWALTFDITCLFLLAVAYLCYLHALYIPVVSFTVAASMLALFNRNRLERLKQFFKRK